MRHCTQYEIIVFVYSLKYIFVWGTHDLKKITNQVNPSSKCYLCLKLRSLWFTWTIFRNLERCLCWVVPLMSSRLEKNKYISNNRGVGQVLLDTSWLSKSSRGLSAPDLWSFVDKYTAVVKQDQHILAIEILRSQGQALTRFYLRRSFSAFDEPLHWFIEVGKLSYSARNT